MRSEHSPVITRITFDKDIFTHFNTFSYAKELWPVVYVLSNNGIKEAYVGETTDLFARMNAHLTNTAKNKLTEAHFITSNWFNKSATLDIESNLIKYLSGDGQYQLLNANIGLANHNYYQKQWYWDLFKDIWNQLRAKGVARHPIEYIDNSDLFKYSPYKSLTREQKKSIIGLLQLLLDPKARNIVLEGGAGTGKTVLAVFLFKLLHSKTEEFNFSEFGEEETQILELTKEVKQKYPDPEMALVVPMVSFRKTLKKVFSNVKGLKAGMVVGPVAVTEKKFDIIVVDEAHRLRRRVTLGTYFSSFDNASAKLGLDKNIHTELDWVQHQAKEKTILFYDENQSIKPSDVQLEDFLKLKSQPNTFTKTLTSQLRARGGKDYVDYLHQLLSLNLKKSANKFRSDKYELTLFDSLETMMDQIRQQDSKVGLSRLVAGYAWPWVSKNDAAKKDIHIENLYLQWNSVNEDWVNSPNAINEVGCIHTTQGYDLNYVGVIFGNEISYDEQKNEIVVFKENYHDRNGRTGVKDYEELKKYIINIYQTLMLRAIQGTYVYVCDEKLRNYFAKHIEQFGQQQKNVDISLETTEEDNRYRIPLYNLKAAAGIFSEEQKVDKVDTVPLPSRYKTSEDFFACIVVGESMNKIIPNGSVCLFRKYRGGTRNGRIVLAELSSRQDPDSGSAYTVKEYHSTKNISEDGWMHESIILKPLTFNEGYEDIKLAGNQLESLKVIGIFECVL